MQLPSEDRYARHRLIPGFSQELVSSLNIGVIGAGAIGNEIIKNLLLMGVGSIDVYDFDTAELTNLTRSIFLRDTDIGKNKAQAVVDRASELHPKTQMRAFAGAIDDTLSLQQFAKYDIAIAAVDNIAARLRINDIALLTNTPWINTAIDSRNVVVELFPRNTPPDSLNAACYVCNLSESVFEREAQRYSCGVLQRASYLTRTIPTTTITASTVGALACSELLRYVHASKSVTQNPDLLGGYKTDISQRVFFDTVTPAVSRTTLAKSTSALGCSGCSFHSEKAITDAYRLSAHELVKEVLKSPSQTVQFSDALILDCSCTRCQASTADTPRLKALLGTRAKSQTDEILRCENCLDNTISIDARETMSAEEFSTFFSNNKPDSAWLIQEERCFDLLPTYP
jgi:molybdopterin-synthase adenylyltransferase